MPWKQDSHMETHTKAFSQKKQILHLHQVLKIEDTEAAANKINKFNLRCE